MPDLDFAFLCDYVRIDQSSGIAHALAVSIDSVSTPQVPTGQNVGLLARFTFSRNECGRPHRIELFFQSEDGGEPLMKWTGTVTPHWTEDRPIGWPTAFLFALNVGLPLPDYGTYSLEVLLDDRSVKSLPLRVTAPAGED